MRLSANNILCYPKPTPCKGIAFFEADDQSCETALYFGGQWIIANADLRREIEAVAPDLAAVFEIFNKAFREGKKSSWSTAIDISDDLEFLQKRVEAL